MMIVCAPRKPARRSNGWNKVGAQGSTDINRALLEAAAIADKERLTFLIFLTDGLSTEGIIRQPGILDNFARSAPANLRLFTFGVGYDVDTFCSIHSGSITGRALTSSRANRWKRSSQFLCAYQYPVLTNLALDFGDMSVYDIYPSPLPDLFADSQIVVVGRYRGGGAAEITLTGYVNDQKQTFTFADSRFVKDSLGSVDALSGLPRLWATRKVGYLLNQIRLKGPDQETIDQIVKLSIRYGIVTPYTSYLVTEPMALGAETQHELSQNAFQQALTAPTQVSGAGAVDKAAEQGQLARAEVAPSLPASAQQQVRTVGSRTFVLQQGIWTDTAFDPQAMTPLKVAFLSKDYFALAGIRPDLAAALALGDQVIVVMEDTAYQVVSAEESVPRIELPTKSVENLSTQRSLPKCSQPGRSVNPKKPPCLPHRKSPFCLASAWGHTSVSWSAGLILSASGLYDLRGRVCPCRRRPQETPYTPTKQKPIYVLIISSAGMAPGAEPFRAAAIHHCRGHAAGAAPAVQNQPIYPSSCASTPDGLWAGLPERLAEVTANGPQRQ